MYTLKPQTVYRNTPPTNNYIYRKNSTQFITIDIAKTFLCGPQNSRASRKITQSNIDFGFYNNVCWLPASRIHLYIYCVAGSTKILPMLTIIGKRIK